MAYMCIVCYEVYTDKIADLAVDDYIFCPKTVCTGEIIQIDDIYMPIIKRLNEKGYFTQSCCSGHIWNNYPNSYIMFDGQIKVNDIKTLPKEHKIEYHDGCITIRRVFNKSKHLNDKDLHKEILENAIDVFEWVESLPDII